MSEHREHNVSITIGGAAIGGLTSYDVSTSMTETVHTFTIEMPFSRAAWDRCRLDAPIKFQIDGVTVLDGMIDEREITEGGDDDLRLVGRNRAGRLLQESAPGIVFADMDLVQLVSQLAAPWYTKVTLSNARNRRVLRGIGKKARAGREPVFVTTSKKGSSRIEPGQTRQQVIDDLCEQAGLLCWPAGDGRELVLGKPNYDQAPQFHFFMPAERSEQGRRSNVMGLSYKESIGDRYSEIIVVGSGRGTDANYGAPVSARIGRAGGPVVATDSPWRGGRPVQVSDFLSGPKRLVLEKAVRSSDEATAYALREMRRRDMQGRTVGVRVKHHGQIVAGQHHTIFAPDLACTVEDERTGLRGAFHVIGCTYRGSRSGGEETSLELVPRGQELVG